MHQGRPEQLLGLRFGRLLLAYNRGFLLVEAVKAAMEEMVEMVVEDCLYH